MKSRIVLAVLVIASGIYPQSRDPRPNFDAASIKFNVNCGERRGRGGGVSPGGYATSCVPLRTLIRLAYAPPLHSFFRQTDVVGGPAWLDTEVYDVVARGTNIGSIDRWRAMLQRLLEDRCNLKIHTETQEVPVYALTVAKGGPKIQPPTPGSCRPNVIGNGIILPPQPATDEPVLLPCGWTSTILQGGNFIKTGLGVTMDEVAGTMLDRLDRLVVNRSGLAGIFDVHLEYAPETEPAAPARESERLDSPGLAPSAPDPTGPSIFSAVQQQLGLKLSPDKGNIEVLVIDHIEKPSDN
jgi:uncharacterized protein (TIGR03435 family)